MKNSLIIPILVLSILSVFSVSATISINSPSASSTASCGVNVFNVSITDGSGLDRESVNLTFYAKSASTANSSWSVIGTNNTVNLTMASNYTFTNINLTSVLEDSNDYIFNVTVKNQTGSFYGSDTNTGITIDCTAPSAPSSLDPTNNEVTSTAGTQTFTATVTDSRTTACTYTIYRGDGTSDTHPEGSTGSATYSSSTCTFLKDFGNITTPTEDNGNWYWSITASDGTNTSKTSAILQVQISPTGGYNPSDWQETTQVSTIESVVKSNEFWVVIAVVVGLVVLYFIFKR